MRRLFIVLVAFCLFLSGVAAGVTITKNLLIVNRDYVAPGKLLTGDPPLNVPDLQTITAGAQTDDEAFRAVADYYASHVSQLSVEFKETNPERLKALFAMYTTNISSIYGTLSELPPTFLDYLQQPYSNCGPYSYYQSIILDYLGVTWRIISISGGTHQFVEANIDGNWEVFDSTVNDWIDTSAFEMERATERHVRKFYTPMMAIQPSASESYDLIYGAQQLRVMMPGLGVFFFPKAYLYISAESPNEVPPNLLLAAPGNTDIVFKR